MKRNETVIIKERVHLKKGSKLKLERDIRNDSTPSSKTWLKLMLSLSLS
jgi:hypothetical protein